LYHYTDKKDAMGIAAAGKIAPSAGGMHGPGVYMAAIEPNASRAAVSKNIYDGADRKAGGYVVKVYVPNSQVQCFRGHTKHGEHCLCKRSIVVTPRNAVIGRVPGSASSRPASAQELYKPRRYTGPRKRDGTPDFGRGRARRGGRWAGAKDLQWCCRIKNKACVQKPLHGTRIVSIPLSRKHAWGGQRARRQPRAPSPRRCPTIFASGVDLPSHRSAPGP
jgi:hypothetical protein